LAASTWGPGCRAPATHRRRSRECKGTDQHHHQNCSSHDHRELLSECGSAINLSACQSSWNATCCSYGDTQARSDFRRKSRRIDRAERHEHRGRWRCCGKSAVIGRAMFAAGSVGPTPPPPLRRPGAKPMRRGRRLGPPASAGSTIQESLCHEPSNTRGPRAERKNDAEVPSRELPAHAMTRS